MPKRRLFAIIRIPVFAEIPRRFLKVSSEIIEVSIKVISSKIEYMLLSIEEKRVENKLFIISVIIVEKSKLVASKKSLPYEIKDFIADSIKSMARIKA